MVGFFGDGLRDVWNFDSRFATFTARHTNVSALYAYLGRDLIKVDKDLLEHDSEEMRRASGRLVGKTVWLHENNPWPELFKGGFMPVITYDYDLFQKCSWNTESVLLRSRVEGVLKQKRNEKRAK